MSSVVVIGAGLAAGRCVTLLRKEGFDGPVTIVGDENQPPYERPPLSKEYMQGKKPLEKFQVHPLEWYAEHSVDTRFDDAAVAIDREAKKVRLASGEELPYDHIVIATGARSRHIDIPGSDLPQVHYLRDLAESDAIRAALVPGAELVIVGGGWIGLEVASSARQAGVNVTVLERDRWPLLAVLGDKIAENFTDLHRSHGVGVQTEVSVEEIVGEDGRVTGVRTSTETIPADFVLIGVGAIPNTELAEAAGLEVDHGVLVDEHLRSSDPDILAVGDVANAWNTAMKARLRVEHWDNAIRQGKLAAKVILGRDDVYDWQPYFYTDQYDMGMEYVGHADGHDEVVARGDAGSGEFIVFWLHDGRVKAAMNVNIWDVNDDLRALIGADLSPGVLADHRVALKDLVKSVQSA